MFKTPDLFGFLRVPLKEKLCNFEPAREPLMVDPRASLRKRCFPYSNIFFFFSRFLTYCPSKRILSDEGLKHEYFRETPLPIDPSMFPTWPAKSEQQRVKRGTSPRPPEGGLGYSQLVRTLGSTFSITYIYQAL